MVSEPSICFYWMNSIGKIAGKKGNGQTILEVPVVTGDFQMREVCITFGIEV